MPAADILRPFKAQQPKRDEVTTYDFVDQSKRLEASIASLVKFAMTATPTGLIVPAYLTAAQISQYFDSTGRGITDRAWSGWAICNGSNGTPSLDGKFPRFETSAAGGTGGSDSSAHTHAVDPGSFTSGAESGHTHAIDHDHGSFSSGSESAHTHGAGSLYAQIDIDTETSISINETAASWTSDAKATVSGGMSASDAQINGALVAGTSAAGSSHLHAVDVPALTQASGASSGHTHAIDVPSTTSGAASATDNRPAYYELVPVMRL